MGDEKDKKDEKTAEAPALTEEDWTRLRHRMDLTDAQLAQAKEAVVFWPKTMEAMKGFGKTLEALGVSEEQIVKIARAIGPVLETLAKESGDRAWAVVDKIQAQLSEISIESEAVQKKLEAEHVEMLKQQGELNEQMIEESQRMLQQWQQIGERKAP